MHKILIITYYWPPSGGAGVQRWLKFAKYLPQEGIEPFVLTVDPGLASYAQRDESLEAEVSPELRVYRTRTFEFYNLYKLLTRKKEIPYGGFANDGKVSLLQRLSRMIRGNFFLPDPRRGWNRYAFKKAVELIREHRIGTVVTTSPPHSTQLVGLELRRKLGIRWIADLRDPWTDIYYYRELRHSALAARRDRALEMSVLQYADQVITVSEDVKRIFAQKLPKGESTRFTVIPNGYDEADFLNHQVPPEDKFVITYTGTISESYDMDGFLRMLELLGGGQRRDMLLRFVGKVPAPVTDRIRERLPDLELELAGYVGHQESVRYLLRSSLQLLIIPRVEKNKGIITGKFFEYLASGKPILALGPRGGDLEALISETGCGKLFDYDDADRMAEYLKAAIAGQVSGAAPDTIEAFSRQALTKKIAGLLLA
ncbi:MAG: glycosyltransferase family 4 protein [Prolixibacteraceae bacterium]